MYTFVRGPSGDVISAAKVMFSRAEVSLPECSCVLSGFGPPRLDIVTPRLGLPQSRDRRCSSYWRGLWAAGTVPPGLGGALRLVSGGRGQSEVYGGQFVTVIIL